MNVLRNIEITSSRLRCKQNLSAEYENLNIIQVYTGIPTMRCKFADWAEWGLQLATLIFPSVNSKQKKKI